MGNGLYGEGALANVLDRNGNGLGGGLPSYTIPNIDFTSGNYAPQGGNLGLPGGYTNMGVAETLQAAGQGQGQSWGPQSHSPFSPGYVAPQAIARDSHGSGGAYSRMQGMGGDGAMSFLSGRVRPMGLWSPKTQAV